MKSITNLYRALTFEGYSHLMRDLDATRVVYIVYILYILNIYIFFFWAIGIFITWTEERRRHQELNDLTLNSPVIGNMNLGKTLSISRSLKGQMRFLRRLSIVTFSEWFLFVILLEDLYILINKEKSHSPKDMYKGIETQPETILERPFLSMFLLNSPDIFERFGRGEQEENECCSVTYLLVSKNCLTF